MKIQVEHYGRTITIEDSDEMTIFELYETFKSIAHAMTFSSSQIDDAIVHIASQIKEND